MKTNTIIRYNTFLILLFFFYLYTGCSDTYECGESILNSKFDLKTGCYFSIESDESKEYKQARKNYKFATMMNSYFFLTSSYSECGKENYPVVEISQGQTLGPFIGSNCFRAVATSTAKIVMITEGTAIGSIEARFPFRDFLNNADDPYAQLESYFSKFNFVTHCSTAKYTVELQ